jgi:hypothetical protein
LGSTPAARTATIKVQAAWEAVHACCWNYELDFPVIQQDNHTGSNALATCTDFHYDAALQMSEALKMDVAGSLFTSMYRNVKIKGQEPGAQNLEGTGSVRPWHVNPVAIRGYRPLGQHADAVIY